MRPAARARRVVRRVRAECWEVWLDGAGYLWAQATKPQDAIAAGERVHASKELLAAGLSIAPSSRRTPSLRSRS